MNKETNETQKENLQVHNLSKAALIVFLIDFVLIIVLLTQRMVIPDLIVYFMWVAIIMNLLGIVLTWRKQKNDTN